MTPAPRSRTPADEPSISTVRESLPGRAGPNRPCRRRTRAAALGDAARWVRMEAVDALGALPSDEARRALARLAETRSPRSARSGAAQAPARRSR